MKFWHQAKLVALKYRKTEEVAEDFASFSVEQVLRYEHFQPMSWLLSRFFGGHHKKYGEEGYHERHCVRFEDFKAPGEDEASLDHLECLSVECDFESKIQDRQIEELRFRDISSYCLERSRTALAAQKSYQLRRRMMRLNSREVRSIIAELKPLELDWL